MEAKGWQTPIPRGPAGREFVLGPYNGRFFWEDQIGGAVTVTINLGTETISVYLSGDSNVKPRFIKTASPEALAKFLMYAPSPTQDLYDKRPSL